MRLADCFFARLSDIVGGALVCEPRHASWFTAEADALLAGHRVARVAADPAPVPTAAQPGGWHGLAYFRLHGSPDVYWSSYSPEAIEAWRGTSAACTDAGEIWTIFDNTASGAALANALAFDG